MPKRRKKEDVLTFSFNNKNSFEIKNGTKSLKILAKRYKLQLNTLQIKKLNKFLKKFNKQKRVNKIMLIKVFTLFKTIVR